MIIVTVVAAYAWQLQASSARGSDFAGACHAPARLHEVARMRRIRVPRPQLDAMQNDLKTFYSTLLALSKNNDGIGTRGIGGRPRRRQEEVRRVEVDVDKMAPVLARAQI